MYQLVGNLRDILTQDRHVLFDWLDEYAKKADALGAERRYEKVIQYLEDAGYTHEGGGYKQEIGMDVAKKSDLLAGYIMAEALKGMKFRKAMHVPSVQKNIAKYREIRQQEQVEEKRHTDMCQKMKKQGNPRPVRRRPIQP